MMDTTRRGAATSATTTTLCARLARKALVAGLTIVGAVAMTATLHWTLSQAYVEACTPRFGGYLGPLRGILHTALYSDSEFCAGLRRVAGETSLCTRDVIRHAVVGGTVLLCALRGRGRNAAAPPEIGDAPPTVATAAVASGGVADARSP